MPSAALQEPGRVRDALMIFAGNRLDRVFSVLRDWSGPSGKKQAKLKGAIVNEWFVRAKCSIWN
jgi:hypothetical protein